jgi:hypothetical protein
MTWQRIHGLAHETRKEDTMRTQHTDQSRHQEETSVDRVQRENEGFWLSFHGFHGMLYSIYRVIHMVAMRVTSNVTASLADRTLPFSIAREYR